MKKSKFMKMQKSFSDFRIANEIYSGRLDDPRDSAQGFSNMVLYYDITSAKKALRMMSNLIGGNISEDQMTLSHPQWDYDLIISSEGNGRFYRIKHSSIKESNASKPHLYSGIQLTNHIKTTEINGFEGDDTWRENNEIILNRRKKLSDRINRTYNLPISDNSKNRITRVDSQPNRDSFEHYDFFEDMQFN